MRYSLTLAGPDQVRDTSSLLELARVAESAGFDACAVADHPFPLVDSTRTGHHTFDLFAVLGALAVATSRIHLHANLLVLPYRNPFLAANAAATVDSLSGGRLILGVGSGYLRAEFDALGVPFSARNDVLDSGLEAMELAWSGEPVRTTSPWWTAAGNTIIPAEGRRTRPMVWIGGNSARAIERAVRFGDGWSPVTAPASRSEAIRTSTIDGIDALERRIVRLRDECRRQGRADLPEICLVQSRGTRTLSAGGQESLARLEELGVTWLCVHPDGLTVAEMARWIEEFAGNERAV